MKYIDKYESLIKEYEKKKYTRFDIINEFIEEIENSVTSKEELIETIYNINDVLNWHGYDVKFQNFLSNKEYENDDYIDLVLNSTKSIYKTEELIKYLKHVSDSRLSLQSLNRLKIAFLIELKLLPNDNKIINENKNKTLYDLYYLNYKNEEIKNIIESTFINLGINNIKEYYMQFKVDLEYLLYTINFSKSKSKPYMKINTIKVALNICPKDYYIWDDKIYYEENISKYIVTYLKLLDKKVAKEIKNKYKDYIEYINDNGYKLLYNLI